RGRRPRSARHQTRSGRKRPRGVAPSPSRLSARTPERPIATGMRSGPTVSHPSVRRPGRAATRIALNATARSRAKSLQSPWSGISPLPACSLFPDGSTSQLAAPERPNREACAMANTRKILIVDDDTELRDAIVEQLALHEEFEAVAAE